MPAEFGEIFLYHGQTKAGDPSPKRRLALLDIDTPGTGEVIEGSPLSLEESEKIFASPNTLYAIAIAGTAKDLTFKQEYHILSATDERPIEDFRVDVTAQLRRPGAWEKRAIRDEVARRVTQRPLNIIF